MFYKYDKFSILHISDLHKDRDRNYSFLFHSLQSDYNNYIHEGIMAPSFIVVSGDLVQGVKLPIRKQESVNELKRQYDEVSEFLNQLVDAFLKGDKKRIIIVPGNHDVDRYCSASGMKKVSAKKNEETLRSYKNMLRGSLYRWSWEKFAFYQINKDGIYKDRFNAFVDFYNHFYNGIYTYPSKPEDEAFCIPFNDYNISFACFNSCKDLDHLNYIGKISKDAIDSIYQELNEAYNRGHLIFGIWHHHVCSSPYYPNFMDRNILRLLRDVHIHIGLFGHQHCSEVADEYRDFEEQSLLSENSILLISSGTLFGNKTQMNPGIRRQYNIVEVNMGNGKADITIHTREDRTGDDNYPSWTKHCMAGTNNYIKRQVTFKKIEASELIQVIDKEIKENNNYWEGALKMRKLYESEGDKIIIKYIDSYLNKISEIPSNLYIKNFSVPLSDTQLVYLINSYINKNEVEKAKHAFDEYKNKWSDSPSIAKLSDELNKIEGQSRWQRQE